MLMVEIILFYSYKRVLFDKQTLLQSSLMHYYAPNAHTNQGPSKLN